VVLLVDGKEELDDALADAQQEPVLVPVLLFVGWMQFVGCPLTAVGYNL
jgi:hypothetical protein